MLLPRFSIRWLFMITAVCAVLSVALAAGWRGEYWAGAFAVGVLFLIFTLVVHAAVFTAARLVYKVVGRGYSDFESRPSGTTQRPLASMSSPGVDVRDRVRGNSES